jgi:hypothetical protein
MTHCHRQLRCHSCSSTKSRERCLNAFCRDLLFRSRRHTVTATVSKSRGLHVYVVVHKEVNCSYVLNSSFSRSHDDSIRLHRSVDGRCTTLTVSCLAACEIMNDTNSAALALGLTDSGRSVNRPSCIPARTTTDGRL